MLANMMTQPAATVDVRGMLCGPGLIRVMDATDALATGDLVEVRFDRPEMQMDLEVWVEAMEHALVDITERDASGERYLRFRKGEE